MCDRLRSSKQIDIRLIRYLSLFYLQNNHNHNIACPMSIQNFPHKSLARSMAKQCNLCNQWPSSAMLNFNSSHVLTLYLFYFWEGWALGLSYTHILASKFNGHFSYCARRSFLFFYPTSSKSLKKQQALKTVWLQTLKIVWATVIKLSWLNLSNSV